MLSIIIPVVRPQNIPQLTEAISKSISSPYELLLEEDTERIGAPKMVKKLTDKTTGDWICFLGDDTLPEQNSLDIALSYAQENDLWLVGLNDQHSTRATHWIASRGLLDYLEHRELFYTGYIHNFCDDELQYRAEQLGKYGWCEQAKITHNHPVFGTAPMDNDYKKVTDADKWDHDKKLFMSRCCRLSVAMIVKNEEVMLGKCLDSVQGADEIIIVDTGSVDKTLQVASNYTDKLFSFPWIDDFAKARNFALAQCTGDWVLSIDADEVLDNGGIKALKELLTTRKDAIGIEMKSGNNHYHVPRLFRNKKGIQWQGRIHEIVNVTDYDNSTVGITYGTSPAHEYDPSRNLRMLEKAVLDEPDNSRHLYYLGREYGYYRDYDKCVETLEKYLTISSWLPERADALYILAFALWHSGQGDKARDYCLMAININSNFKAALLLMAQMSWQHNAAQWLRMAETASNEGTLFKRLNADSI